MGSVFKPKFAWTKRDGTRVEKVTEEWYIGYTDSTGKWIRRKAGITKEQAQDALRKAEMDVLNEKNGLPTQRAGEFRCLDLLNRFLNARRGNVSESYVYQVERHAKDVIQGCRAVTVRQLKPDAVETYLNGLAEGGASPRNVNAHLLIIKTVLRWAVSARLLPYNPLDCIKKRKEFKVRPRRAMTPAELRAVLDVAVDGPARRKLRVYQNRPRKDGTYKPKSVPLALQAELAMQGRNNALAYRLMVEVGLRKSEAASLTWADVDLTAGTLTTRPWWTGNKNDKEETLPLSPGLLDALRRWRELHPQTTKVVAVSDRLLECFYDDLVAAGIAKRVPLEADGNPILVDAEGRPCKTPAKWQIDTRDSAGRVLDLHALRHTFGTLLVASGADIKTVQSLMRHSTPALTLAIYIHKDEKRMAQAVAGLPDLTPSQNSEPDASQPNRMAG